MLISYTGWRFSDERGRDFREWGQKWIDGLVQLQSSWQQCSVLLSAVDCANSPSEQRLCILEPRYEPGLRECRVGEGGSTLNRRTRCWLCYNIPHFPPSQGLSVPGTAHSLSVLPAARQCSRHCHISLLRRLRLSQEMTVGFQTQGYLTAKPTFFFFFFFS